MTEKTKKKKSHTTIYFPRESSEFIMKAISAKGEQLYGRGSHGKASAYVLKLITKDLKESGLLEFDENKKKLVPVEKVLKEIEKEVQKKYEESMRDEL